MKALLFLVTGCFLVGSGSFFLRAQTNADAGAPANPQAAREYKMISFLAPADREKYAKAHAKALADNPALKTEGDAIIKQGQSALAGGTAADKQAFMEAMNAHRQKLRAAMLKEDPTLEPVFVQIDQHISEMKAKQLGNVQSSPSSSTPAAAGPPTAK